MIVKRRKISLSEEKSILTGLIVSEKFTREMYTIVSETYHYFKSSQIKVVIGWCLKYFEEFDKPIYSSIQDVFNSHLDDFQKEDDIDLIESLLEDISDTYVDTGEEFDYAFHITEGTKYCRIQSMLNHASELKGLAESQEIDRAEHKAGQFQKVGNRITEGLDPANASSERENIYSPDNDITLIKFPGALGTMFNKLERGGLYLIAGASKRGKTSMFLEFLKYCRMAGLNCSVYTLEMKREKLLVRWDMGLTRSLMYEPEEELDEFETINRQQSKDILIPYFDADRALQYKKITATPVNKEKGDRVERLFNKQYRKGSIKIFDITTTNNTLSAIIQNEQNEQKYNGWNSDIVFVDSLYLLSDQFGDSDHAKLSNIHRRAKQELAEKLNKGVISPIQHNKEALKGEADEGNIAGSYNIYSHASAILHLNATKEEMEKGVIRCNSGGRDGNYAGTVLCTRGLDIGRGFIESEWLHKIPNYNEFIKGDIETMTSEDEEELSAMSLEDV